LRCGTCSAWYPVDDGIPILIHPDRSVALDPARRGIELPRDGEAIDEDAVLRANVRYHEEHAGQYEHDASTEEVFSDEAASRIRDVIALGRALTRGHDWLDAGCGTGHVLGLATEEFPSAVGVDLSLAMLRRAHKRGLRVARAEAYGLPFADESIDVVSAFALLHHLYDVDAFYREAFRVLRPGGLFYSDCDPNVRQRRTSLPYRVARQIYYATKRLGRRQIADDPKVHHVAKLADYQMFYGRDFNGDRQAAVLGAIGFDPTNVIYHFNARSIYFPSQAPLRTHIRGLVRTPVDRWFDMRIAADHFLLLAIKPRR
jgi:ubiquinone/menaquinone biosynthesis C-methylase UbiE